MPRRRTQVRITGVRAIAMTPASTNPTISAGTAAEAAAVTRPPGSRSIAGQARHREAVDDRRHLVGEAVSDGWVLATLDGGGDEPGDRAHLGGPEATRRGGRRPEADARGGVRW